MFTIEAIRTAHAKVKSGAMFPQFIQDIIQLGVTGYETFVTDGNTVYFGAGEFRISTGPKYASLSVSNDSKPDQFKQDLKLHQQGGTNYPTFCADCARSGIEKWVVKMDQMSCTYFDVKGSAILVETIPVP